MKSEILLIEFILLAISNYENSMFSSLENKNTVFTGQLNIPYLLMEKECMNALFSVSILQFVASSIAFKSFPLKISQSSSIHFFIVE